MSYARPIPLPEYLPDADDDESSLLASLLEPPQPTAVSAMTATATTAWENLVLLEI
jgi:hypothetical protein